jgi:RNA polymerase sigma-70 factor (ECF subfamily)
LLIPDYWSQMPEPADQHSSTPSRPSDGYFATTHWTVVVNARATDTIIAREALEKLCQTYWYPLYAFVRRQGRSPHDAQDFTQEFFARLLEKNYLEDVDRAKGRFRSFLLAAMKHFLANEWDKARAQKRGGAKTHIPIDTQFAETRYGMEPGHDQTPEKLFERRWALTLLDNVLTRLREEHVAAGKAEQFDGLKIALTADKRSIPYTELGARLGLSEGAVKVAVHRLRARYREVLRAEIANTVASAADVEEEIRQLFAALSG